MILVDEIGTISSALLLFAFLFAIVRVSRAPAYKARLQANRRADKLMREVLSEREYRQLRLCGFMDIASPNTPGRVYRIPRSRDQVRVYECGRLVERLCVQSVLSIPTGDIVVMHKLLIQGDEEEYLKTANHFA